MADERRNAVCPGNDATLIDWLNHWAHTRSDAPAFTFVSADAAGRDPLTFSELLQRAARVGAGIAERLEPGARAVLAFTSDSDFIEAFLGCQIAGAIPVPASVPRYKEGAERLSTISEHCAADLIITDETTLPSLSTALARFRPDGRSPVSIESLRGARQLPLAAADPDAVAMIQYTSGSTGAPKGVTLSHRNIMHNQAAIARAFRHGPDTVFAGVLPLFHDMGLIGNVMQSIYLGIHCVLIPPAALVRRPACWFEAITLYGVTTSGGPNALFDLCVDRIADAEMAGLDLSTWSVAFNGAEPVSARTLDRFADRFERYGFRRSAFVPCYGLAEATLIVAGAAAGKEALVRDVDRDALAANQIAAPPGMGLRLVASGQPVEENSVRIVARGGATALPPGAVGEIWISSDSVADRYWNDQLATTHTFRARIAGDNRQYLRTGDLGYLDENGMLFVTGRDRDLIIVNGRNYYPNDLEEAAIASHLSIARAAAFESGDGVRRVVLLVEATRAARRTLTEPGVGREVLRRVRTAIYRVHGVAIDEVAIVGPGKLPRTTSGKLRRGAARAAWEEGTLPLLGDFKQTTTEVAAPDELANAIGSFLGIPLSAVEWSLPLIALGVDSLRAAALSAYLEARGVDCPPAVLLSAESLAEIRGASTPSPPAPSPPHGDIDASFSLSEWQKPFWLTQQKHPLSGAQNVRLVATLRKEGFDQAAWARAVTEVAARHDALRTTFLRDTDGLPRQRFTTHGLTVTEIVEAAQWSSPQIDQHIATVVNAPFDLEYGPPFRSGIILTESRVIVVLVAHHIVVDLTAMATILSEIAALHTAEVAGRRAELPPAPSMRNWISEHCARMSQLAEDQAKYWNLTLAGDPDPLTLPVDRTRRRRDCDSGAREYFTIGADAVTRLRSVCADANVTLHMGLLAVYRILLYRYGGQRDALIGTPLSRRGGRDHALVGCLTNPAAIRCPMDGGDSFADMLDKVRVAVLGAMRHGDLPFHAVVRAGAQPLATMFALQSSSMAEAAPLVLGVEDVEATVGGMTFSGYPLKQVDVPFDLGLMMIEQGQRLRGCFEYRAAAFDNSSVSRLARHFATLLHEAVRQPNRAVAALAMLDASDRTRLEELRQGRRDLVPERLSLPEAFSRQVAATPDKVAVKTAEEQLSYAALGNRVSHLARSMDAAGLGVGDRVGLAVRPSPDWIAAMLAVWRIGAIVVSLDRDVPRERVRAMIADAGLRAIIVDDDPEEALAEAGGAPLLALSHLAGMQAFSAGPEQHAADPLATAYIAFTSGSSGRPKGVMVSHDAARNFALGQAAILGRAALLNTLQLTPPSFDASFSDVLMSLFTGGTLCIPPSTARIPGRQLANFIASERVTLITATPAVLAGLDPTTCPDVAAVISMGDTCPPELARRWSSRCAFYNGYGPTEATIGATLGLVTGGSGDGVESIDIGSPLPNVHIHIFDADLNALPAGVTGEIYIGGRGVAQGYVNDPGQTAARFLPDPSSERGARMYRTGDRGHWSADGRLVFKGRLDRQIKLRGVRIEPGEIEALLREHPTIDDCIVEAAPGGNGHDGLIAHVAGAHPADDAELRAWLRPHLPASLLPHRFVRAAAIAQGPTGKRILAPATLAEQTAAIEPAVEPDDQTRIWLREAWRQVLGDARFGDDDSFFEVGGHSLVLPQLQTAIERRIGRTLDLLDLFDFPTIRTLGRHLNAGKVVDHATARASATGARAPIAVIGMAGRFPGSPDLEMFWRNVEAGRSSITQFSPEDLKSAGLKPDPSFVAARGVIDGIEDFDHEFFAFSRREAEILDPQKRILLELAQGALDDAAYSRSDDLLANRVGVFVGTSRNSYFENNVSCHDDIVGSLGRIKIGIASDPGFAATLIGFKLNLSGPCINIDTACSTSLVAVHQACQSLWAGDCDAALAGGASIDAPVVGGHRFEPGMIGSSDGFCRAFDARADGTVKGMGAALVLLKPLDAALRDGDPIHAVIRGTAINNDGARKIGFTAPSTEGQADAIRRALDVAGVPAESIGFIEAHGTGTALGDPIEIAALNRVFGVAAPASIALGAVKANIGHLDAAAGIAGLIKAILVVRQGLIPPLASFETPNPRIDWSGGPFSLPTQARRWDEEDRPRRAGVSAFGVGGTNAHVVLEQRPPPRECGHTRAPCLVPLSAGSPAALRETARDLARFLRGRDVAIADVAFTLCAGRRALAWRASFVVESIEALTDQLADDAWEPVAADRQAKPAAIAAWRTQDCEDLAPLRSLGESWERGDAINPGALNPPGQRVHLPGVAFRRTRIWLDPVQTTAERRESSTVTADEDLVAKLWQKFLGLHHIDEAGDFFELGGDSLLAIELLGELSDRIGISLPSSLVHTHPTLGDLRNHIAALAQTNEIAPVGTVRDQPTKLTAYQHALWIAEHLERAGAAMNLTVGLRFEAATDADRLQAALRVMLQRHSILLNNFALEDGAPAQWRAHSPEELILTVEAYSGSDPSERIADHADTEFDIRSDLLFKTILLRNETFGDILAVTTHHLVADGQSLILMLNDLIAAYREPRELPPVVTSYADIVAPVRISDSEAGGNSDGDTLEIGTTAFALPSDRLAPDDDDKRAGSLSIVLSPELTHAIRALGRSSGLTTFAILLATFELLIARAAGKDAVVVACPITMRRTAAEHQVVGPFVALELFSHRSAPGETFRDRAAALHCSVAAAMDDGARPQGPNSWRLGEANGQGSPPGVAFALNHALPAEVNFAEGLRALPFLPGRRHARHRAMMWIDEGGDQIRCSLEYRTAHYEPATIARYLEAYRHALEVATRTPDVAIDEIEPFASDALLTAAWNDTTVARAAMPTLAERIAAAAAERPEAVAIAMDGESLTFGALAAEVERVGVLLRTNGLAAEDRVGVLLDRSVGSVVTCLGVLHAGGCFVPLAPDLPEPRLRQMIEAAGVRIVLTDDAHRSHPAIAGAATFCWLDAPAKLIDAMSSPVRVPMDSLAYILFTSGSTGIPKGVMVSHRALTNRLDWMIAAFAIGDGDVVLHKTPLGFDVSVWELLVPPLVGATMVVAPPGAERNPARLSALIADHGVTIVHFVPSMLRSFLDWGPRPAPSLRLCVCSGEALDRDCVRRTRAWLGDTGIISNLYGPTEAAIDVTMWVADPAGEVQSALVPIGRPIDNIRMHVLDERLRPVPIGIPGELYIGGIGLARGYASAPELTAAAFVPSPFGGGERLYRTGDRGRWTADSEIEFLGRVDAQIKLRGVRIEPGDIECVLRGCELVADVAVSARGERGFDRLVAHVVPHRVAASDVWVALRGDGAGTSEHEAAARFREEVRKYVIARLPRPMVPDNIVLLDAIPITGNGKRDLGRLPETDRLSAKLDHAPTLTPTETRLAQLWRQAIGGAMPSRDDDFFNSGGHSLAAVRLLIEIKREFGVALDFAALHETPSLAGLAEAITRGDCADIRVPVLGDPGARFEPFPMSVVQQAYMIGRSPTFALGGSTQGYVEIAAPGLDRMRFKRVLNRLIDQHDMLRAVACDTAMLRVLPTVPIYEPQYHDLRALPLAEAKCARERIRDEMVSLQFDPRHWPLLAVRVTEAAQDDVIVHVVVDALIADGASALLLERELNRLYSDETAVSEPPATTFRDFAVARAAQRSTARHAAARRYWIERAETLPEAPMLPLRSGAVAARRIASVRRRHVVLTLDEWSALQGRARTMAATPVALVIAAYAEILSLWSGDPHFVINLPVSGRLDAHPDSDQIIGNFTSTILLEIDLLASDDFDATAARIHQRLWTDLAHLDFDGIELRRYRTSRDRGFAQARNTVVFTGLLGLVPARDEEDAEPARIFDLSRELGGVSRTSQVLLDCIAIERHDGVALNWDYVEEAFPPGLIAEMFDTFVARLRAVASSTSPLPPVEAPRPAWRAAGIKVESCGYETQTLVGPVIASAKRAPNACALVAGATILDYRDLCALGGGIASQLRRQGVRRGDVVAIHAEKGWAQPVAALGIMMAGAAYVPVDTNLPIERQHLIFAESGARVAVTQPHFAARAEAWGAAVTPVALDGPRDSVVGPEPAPSDLAYVIFTSGSTGRPKGVEIDHAAAANTIADINARFSVSAEDSMLAVSDMGFDLSVFDMFGLLAAGGRIIFPDADRTLDAGHWGALVAKHGVTIWNSAPQLAAHFAAEVEHHPQGVAESLRAVLLSGDWIPLDLPDRMRAIAPRAQVVSLGGATEAAIWSIIYPIDAIDSEWRSIPYGKPLTGQDVMVLDAALRHCATWTTGEIWIAGHGLGRRYRNAPDMTSQSFVVHPQWKQRMYRTGDLGRYLPDGDIEFLGRRDSQVKLHGLRLELAEVEAVLEAHEGVDRAVVLADRDGLGAVRRLAAYVSPNGRVAETDAATQRAIRKERLAAAWLDISAAGLRAADSDVEMSTVERRIRELDRRYIGALIDLFRGWGRLDTPGRRFDVDTLIEEHAVAPRYRRWLARATAALVTEGFLEEVAPNSFVTATCVPRLSDTADGDVPPLAAILREEVHSAQIYASDATAEAYQTYYGGCHAVARAVVKTFIDTVGRRGVAALELGAGYGSMTRHLISDLPLGSRYLFTDISAFFLDAAVQAFPSHSGVERQYFDMNVDPQLQGVANNSLDLVVAASVLHNARNLPEVLCRIRRMLAPGGLLVMIEETVFHRFFDLGMGLQQGFDEGVDLLRGDHPLLSRDTWKRALADAGFANATVFDRLGTPEALVGFDVIAAQAPATAIALDPTALAKHVERHLPRVAVPSVWVEIEAFPLKNGKIDRTSLTLPPQPILTRTEPLVAPRTRTEEDLIEIWRGALGVPSIGVTDNFFEAGGDSLIASRIVAEVHTRLGRQLTLQALFEAATVADLASIIDTEARRMGIDERVEVL